MDDIIGILLYNSFVKLPDSNQTLEENQRHCKLPRAGQAGRKNMLHNAKPARTCESLRRNQKKAASLCEIALHERHFCPFALEYLNIRNVSPTSKLRETQVSLGFVSVMNRAHRPKA